MSAPDQTPTPWTDAAERDHSNLNDDCRTLERHLRRIITARENLRNGNANSIPLLSAISAAKEELSI